MRSFSPFNRFYLAALVRCAKWVRVFSEKMSEDKIFYPSEDVLYFDDFERMRSGNFLHKKSPGAIEITPGNNCDKFNRLQKFS